MRSKSTNKKTEQNVKRFKEWVAEQSGFYIEIEDIEPENLNHLLVNFILNCKKLDGSDYEADTLTGYMRSIERYLPKIT